MGKNFTNYSKIIINSRQKTPLKRYVAGSLAAVTATTITYPLDTAKARLSVSTKSEYKNMREVFIKEYRKYGFFTFYRGINPTILGVIPYAGSSFFTFESLKIVYKGNFSFLIIF